MMRIVLKVYFIKLINSSHKDSEKAWCSDVSKKVQCSI